MVARGTLRCWPFAHNPATPARDHELPGPVSASRSRMSPSFIDLSPILQSVMPVIAASRNVRTNAAEIRRVASWMAYEEFTLPGDMFPFDMGRDPDHLLDVSMLSSSLDFAFTDFSTSVKFEVEHGGTRWSDSDAMFACLHRAIQAGVPITTGAWQAAVTRPELEEIFRGSIEMPMLDERVAILNEIGTILEARYEGRWATWARGCERALYSDGNGLLERMVVDFPRFRDESVYDGETVRIAKLAQLSLWALHAMWVHLGQPGLSDIARMTAFADYIVPVGLRLMGITEYTRDLEDRINGGVLIPRDSPDEIEIRAHTLYATALLAEACNELRPADRQVVIPQIDYRFWKAFHTTHWPHHLTRTVMY
jgi:hypothetical protein